jgi:RHS repeat-associated protein
MLTFVMLFSGCADAGKDQVVESSTKVILDGSSSTTEAGGKIVKYKWTQISGKKVKLEDKNKVQASFIAPVVEKDTILIFNLSVVEKDGYYSPLFMDDSIEILVKPIGTNNTIPQAIIQTSSTNIKINQTINFDASNSKDEDGEIVSYEWKNQDGDILSTDKIFDYTFLTANTYTITLTVTDNDSLSSSSSVEIVVNDLIKPEANINVSATTINSGEAVTFDATNSSDTDGEIVSYLWTDENLNILSSEKTFTKSFNTQGEYKITLSVEDNDGQTSSKDVTINVQSILNSIELTPSDISIHEEETKAITAMASYSDGSTVEVSSNVTWEVSDATIVSMDNTGTLTALKAGTATIKASIGDIKSNEITITVLEPITLNSIQVLPNPILLRINNQKTISIKGIYSDGSINNINESFSYEIENTNIASFDGTNTITALQEGETTLKITVGNISTQLIPIKVNSELVTTNFDFTSFGTQYIDQIPANATKEKYDENLFSMLTGKILSEDGTPIQGVIVSILNHDEYGSVLTDENGSYILPTEGGKYITIRYQKNEFITSDRKVYVSAGDWAIAPDVTMLKLDNKVTTINLKDTNPPIHKSTVITDDRGSRSTTLVFNNVTKATVTSKDGSTRELETIDVRATEFKTPASMPATLPTETAYTYCSDLTVDGVNDDETVEFNFPVIMYVDNFLGFNVGEIVPIGYYDRNKGEWVGSKNGAVVQLLDTDGDGKVDSLDATGDGEPDDIDGDGSITSEVNGIKDNSDYQIGMTYWRAEITHFTPWDHNWPYGPPDDAVDADGDITNDDNIPKSEPSCIDSYIEPKKRIVHEDIKIAGTNLTLHYTSKRVSGYKYIIDVSNIVSPPASAKFIIIKLEIAGKVYEKKFTPLEFKNNASFEWDGYDKLGRHLNGNVIGKISFSFEYDAIYYKANTDFEKSWAKISSVPTAIKARDSILLSKYKKISINVEDINTTNNAIANGWDISNNMRAYKDLIQKGNGENIKINNVSGIIQSFLGNGIESPSSEGIITENTTIYRPTFITFDNEGNMYFIEGSSINKITINNELIKIIGDPIVNRAYPDNVPAIESNLGYVTSIAFDSKGNMYIAENTAHKIRKIDTNGIITTIAGTGRSSLTLPKNGDIAISTKLYYPRSVVVDKNDNVYFDNYTVIMRINEDGTLTRFAGTGEVSSTGDGGLAINASFQGTHSLFIDKHNNMYLSEQGRDIRKIDSNGIVSTIVKRDNSLPDPKDGDVAMNSRIFINTLIADNNGNIYFSDFLANRIIKIDTDGIIHIIAGGKNTTLTDDNINSLDAKFGSILGLAMDNNGNLFLSDTYNSKIRKIVFPSLNSSGQTIYSDSNNIENIFNEKGNIEKSIDKLTKKIYQEFFYDEKNKLVSIKDQFENEIQINRINGVTQSIIAPNGQITSLDIDINGDLKTVSYENNSTHTFNYNNSLLEEHKKTNGQMAYYIYDNTGRIIKEIDRAGAEWLFEKEIKDSSIEYIITKPENDFIIYQDEQLNTGFTQTKTIFSNEDELIQTTSNDLKELNILSNNVINTKKYITDFNTFQNRLSSILIRTPNNLQKNINYTNSYKLNDDDLTLLKTQTIMANNKSTIIKNDYENGINSITTPEGRVAKEEYDINTRLITSSVSGTLTPTTYEYDSKGRVISQNIGSRTTSFTYNSRGNIDTITDARGKTSSYEYDLLDRVTKVTHPNGAVEEYKYDVSGNMTKLITPISTNHDFTYDNLDQRKSMNSPLNKQTSYSYNGNRKLTQITRPSGKTIVNNYVNDRLDSTITPEATINYGYIFRNQVGTITKGNEKIEYTYDGDLLTSLTYSGVLNQVLNYTYNNDFLPITSSYAGTTENYTYDNDGLVLTSGDYTLTRDTSNAYVTKITDGSLVQNLSYDNYAELIKVSDNSFTYEITSKDNSALILQKQETINNITKTYDYTYDDNARLIEVKKDGNVVETYSYDNNGNRTSATVNGVTKSGYYTLDDQVEVYGDNTYTYNEDGYLSSKVTPNGTTTYSYSTLGELKEVKTPSKTITYKHNASNQRVAKLIDGVVVEKYLWADLTTLLAVYDGDDNLVQRFEYANSRMPISMTQDSSKYHLHYDQVGSLKAVTDSNHNIIKEIIYDSFGNILSDSNESFSVAFGFAGGLLDKDTNLTRFGYRDYDSFIGKWTAKDPIDFSGGDTNLYGYVLNDPVNFVDSDGLAKGVPSFWDLLFLEGDPNADKVPKTKQDPKTKYKYFENPKDKTWWTVDKAGHGESCYKQYEKKGNKLNHIGDYNSDMEKMNKHKGKKGQIINWKDLIGL